MNDDGIYSGKSGKKELHANQVIMMTTHICPKRMMQRETRKGGGKHCASPLRYVTGKSKLSWVNVEKPGQPAPTNSALPES